MSQWSPTGLRRWSGYWQRYQDVPFWYRHPPRYNYFIRQKRYMRSPGYMFSHAVFHPRGAFYWYRGSNWRGAPWYRSHWLTKKRFSFALGYRDKYWRY